MIRRDSVCVCCGNRESSELIPFSVNISSSGERGRFMCIRCERKAHKAGGKVEVVTSKRGTVTKDTWTRFSFTVEDITPAGEAELLKKGYTRSAVANNTPRWYGPKSDKLNGTVCHCYKSLPAFVAKGKMKVAKPRLEIWREGNEVSKLVYNDEENAPLEDWADLVRDWEYQACDSWGFPQWSALARGTRTRG